MNSDELFKIFSTATMLFLVLDPLGNPPLFVSLLKDYGAKTMRFPADNSNFVNAMDLFDFSRGSPGVLFRLSRGSRRFRNARSWTSPARSAIRPRNGSKSP